ncbi:RES family NAD+ phosphorylase [Sungkyunkwania multivorans]|uniref:RES family NAD+ phosphorylase n=1 Tax=Sungkyunkwania multivorans TaxID=1173618 RepID=A0ABW3D3H0_9FLAO
MVVYRIDREKRKNDLLSGVGAQEYGGRWNKIGTKAIYASQHVSLAYLEVAMHLNMTMSLPTDRILVHIEIPNTIKIETLEKLPTDWRRLPYNYETQEIFTRFCKQERGLVLRVPSVVVPSEYNFIINPIHKDFKRIKILKTEKFIFDDRLLK